MNFSHLHNHTQYSLLDGASNISKLYEKARADNMPAMAITDHGNMFGAFEFVKESKAYDAEGVIAEVSPYGQVVQLEDVRLADYMYDHMVAAAPNCAMIYVKMYAKASIIDVTESMGYKLQFVVTKVYLPDGKIVYFPIKKSSN